MLMLTCSCSKADDGGGLWHEEPGDLLSVSFIEEKKQNKKHPPPKKRKERNKLVVISLPENDGKLVWLKYVLSELKSVYDSQGHPLYQVTQPKIS